MTDPTVCSPCPLIAELSFHRVSGPDQLLHRARSSEESFLSSSGTATRRVPPCRPTWRNSPCASSSAMASRSRTSRRSPLMRLTVSASTRQNHPLPHHYHHESGIDRENRCRGPRKAWLSSGSNSAHLGQVNTSLDCLRRRRAAIGLCGEEQGEECERCASLPTLIQLFLRVMDTDILTGLKYLAMTLTALPKEFLQSTHSKHDISRLSYCSDGC